LIIGAQRSGTSLLSRMLNQHPGIAVPGESFFFNTFGPLHRFYGDLALAENRSRLIDDALATAKISEWRSPPSRAAVQAKLREPTLGGIFRAILDAWTEAQGKQRWGEKTPQHVLHWRHVHEALPDAPLVHIVRDGRDVALSLVAAQFGPKTIYAAAHRWRRYIRTIAAIKASAAPGRLHEIRYEDLLQQPEKVLAGVCAFLGEPYSPRLLEFHKDSTAYNGYGAEHRNLRSPLLSQNAARWQRQMTARDVRIFESIAARELTEYGYALATDGAPLRAFERVYLSCIVNPPAKALAMLCNDVGRAEVLQLAKIRSRAIARHALGLLTRKRHRRAASTRSEPARFSR
jgi:hypothetical protein